MDKIIVLIALVFFSFFQSSFADTCPSISDIQKQLFHGFKAYDTDDGKPLPPKRLAYFARHAEQFILAEWQDTQGHFGEIHCFYRDGEGSQMETYLMKTSFKPENSKNWYQVSGSMHCAAGMNACLFKKHLPRKRLARI